MELISIEAEFPFKRCITLLIDVLVKYPNGLPAMVINTAALVAHVPRGW